MRALGVAGRDLGLEVRVVEVAGDLGQALGEGVSGDPGAVAVVVARRLRGGAEAGHVPLAQPLEVVPVARADAQVGLARLPHDREEALRDQEPHAGEPTSEPAGLAGLGTRAAQGSGARPKASSRTRRSLALFRSSRASS